MLDIPEYWIVDPLTAKIEVLTLAEGWYDAAKFLGSDVLQSPTFPELKLTAEEILAGDL